MLPTAGPADAAIGLDPITVENAILHTAFSFMNSLSVRMICYTHEKSCMMCYSST